MTATFSITNDTQHNNIAIMMNVIMLSVAFFCYALCHYGVCHFDECHYAECRYAECRYAECHGALKGLFYVHNKLECLCQLSIMPVPNAGAFEVCLLALPTRIRLVDKDKHSSLV
jgi:hypothetical protein